MSETLYLTVTLLDQYLSQVAIKKTDSQLVGLTTLLLASKYEDFWHPRVRSRCSKNLFCNKEGTIHCDGCNFFLSHFFQVKDLISISAEAYTRDQMLEMVHRYYINIFYYTTIPLHPHA